MIKTKSEYELRKTHIKTALLRAFDQATKENWFETLSSIQEAEIITRVIVEQNEMPENEERL